MKKKMHKILGVALTIVLLGSLTAGMAVVPASADPATNVWSKLSFPLPGSDGKFFRDPLIEGLGPWVKAINDDFYAYMWNDSVTTNDSVTAGETWLVKSTDGGRNWSKLIKYAGGAVTDFAASSEDADVLYVLAANKIYKTANGGSTFTELTAPALATTLTSIDVGYVGGNPYVFVAASAISGGTEYAWSLDETSYGAPWTGLAMTSPVYEIACSPNFSDEAAPLLLAVAHQDASAAAGEKLQVWYKFGAAAWNTTGGIGPADLFTLGTATAPASKPYIAFPDDFDSDLAITATLEFWVSINDGTGGSDTFGGLYRVIFDTATEKTGYADATNADDDDFYSVDVKGPVGAESIFGGYWNTGANTITVLRSLDNASSWLAAKKAPTGDAKPHVIMADDFMETDVAWCLTDGSAVDKDIALSIRTADRLWNQISLIDTDLATMTGLSFSDAYADDGVLFVASVPSGTNTSVNDSLWKYGSDWERVVCVAAIAGVQCSPFYSTDNAVFYHNGTAIYRSLDGGAFFWPQTKNPGALNSWAVIDKITLIAGGAATVYRTTNNGASTWVPYTTGLSGLGTISAFAFSPDFEFGETGDILAGTNAGQVVLSSDFGKIWSELKTSVGTGTMLPTFADDYSSEGSSTYVYAANSLGGVYRYEYGVSTSWTRIDAVGGSPTAGAGVGADSFAMAWTDTGSAGNEVVTITVASGAVSISGVTGATVTYAAPTYTITSPGAGAAVTVTVTCLSPPATGIITNVTPSGAITNTLTDADGDASVTGTIASTAGAQGTFSLMDVAGVTTAAAYPVSAGGGIAVVDGTLYATDSAAAEGMSRSLNPTGNVLHPTKYPYFERISNWAGGYMTTQLLAGLWKTVGSPVTLWAIDNSGTAPIVWYYEDVLSVSSEATAPKDGATVAGEGWAALSWTALPGATLYDVMYDTSPEFAVSPTIVTPELTSTVIDGLRSGTTYYWMARVSAQRPCRSNWSAPFSFTTAMSAAAWTPGTVPQGTAPAPGATGTTLRPTFQWNPSAGASGYEFELSPSPGITADGYFVDVLVGMTGANALANNVWQCDRDLDYASNYFWHVRAISATGKSGWFSGVFTTMAAPVAPPAPTPPVEIPAAPAPITPAWIWAIVIIGAILVIAVIVLIVTTRRVP